MRVQDKTRPRRHVFIDTSIYEAHAYEFDARVLNALFVRVQSKRVALHTTSVVVREIERHIQERVRATVEQHKRLVAKAGPVRGFLADDLLRPLDEEQLVRQALSRFKEFLTACGAIIHSVSRVDPEAIMELHFAGVAPFEKSGKKKNEFRDAFSLSALSLWGSENDETVDVLSLDDDMRKACGETFFNLRHGGNLAAFLDELVREDHNAEEVTTRLQTARARLEASIVSAFEDASFILDHLEGEVYAVEVRTVEIGDVFVFEARGSTFELEVHARVVYTAHIEYRDYTNASYDREDHTYFGVERRQSSLEDARRISVTVAATLEPGVDELRIGDCTLSGGSLAISLEADDDDLPRVSRR